LYAITTNTNNTTNIAVAIPTATPIITLVLLLLLILLAGVIEVDSIAEFILVLTIRTDLELAEILVMDINSGKDQIR